jgi:predicted  nucleic acid-binding Zn-ribbon protein
VSDLNVSATLPAHRTCLAKIRTGTVVMISAKDTSIVGEDTDCGEDDLQEAVATASAGLARDLRCLGGHLASMESGHRAVLDRLQSIAGQADERARHQLSSVQQQVEAARAEILRARENLETVFLEQVQVMQGLCESTRQQINKTEQQLHFLEARVGATEDKQDSAEQRLQAAEQKNLESENWLETIRSHLGQFQRQITDAAVRIRSVEPDINAINSMLQVQAVQCENMQAAIGDLRRDVDQLRARAMLRSGRWLRPAALAACLLILVGYVELGRPGFAGSALDNLRSFAWAGRISWALAK